MSGCRVAGVEGDGRVGGGGRRDGAADDEDAWGLRRRVG